MADKYINATKLIERLKEERAHSTASAPWDFAFAGTMLEISTRRVLNAVIEVLEGEPAADVAPCPAPNWPICQNCGKPMVYCGEEKIGDVIWKRYKSAGTAFRECLRKLGLTA